MEVQCALMILCPLTRFLRAPLCDSSMQSAKCEALGCEPSHQVFGAPIPSSTLARSLLRRDLWRNGHV